MSTFFMLCVFMAGTDFKVIDPWKVVEIWVDKKKPQIEVVLQIDARDMVSVPKECTLKEMHWEHK